MHRISTYRGFIASCAAAAFLSACSGGTNGPQTVNALPAAGSVPAVMDASRASWGNPYSVLKHLTKIRTIGSTVDPKNGDQNPYGLDLAKSTAGKITKGDLVICNFNDKANVQGTGTTMEVLHPAPGSKPARFAQGHALLGCAAVALDPADFPWVAAYAANDNPIYSPTGQLLTTLSQWQWWGPWGQAYASKGATGGAAFYESNAQDGTIVRIDIDTMGNYTFETIANGFGINNGVPGSILAPSGLQYDPKCDRLYVVDGQTNTVVAFNDVTTIPSNGITVGPKGTTFSGPFASRGKVIWAGAPLNGPISSALLPNGNLVIGNTLNATGKNVMVELSSAGGKVLATKNVDTGASGAIFGMVASGTDNANTTIYFNDDNANAVEQLVP